MRAFLALPVLNEAENLPGLFDMLSNQTWKNFVVYVCVNQPDKWWGFPEKTDTCLNNQKSIALLADVKGLDIKIIDRSSKGKGWKGKHFGVGWARKTAMDELVGEAKAEDIIISIDADTNYPPAFIGSVVDTISSNPDKFGLAVPYYHPLTGTDEIDRAILRYEIYMRNYALNMWHIRNPYRYTALGSAMAFPVWAYRKVNGLTPHKSGEDFYFLQKLRKAGELLYWNPVKAYPSARKSERVFFGTGPAVIKGIKNDWSSYPLYHHSLFNQVRETFLRFGDLYKRDIATPMDEFIKSVSSSAHPWKTLRGNSAGSEKFIKACQQKVDGLRILQFLKKEQRKLKISDARCLAENMKYLFGETCAHLSDVNTLSFTHSKVELLDDIRNYLVKEEDNILANSTGKQAGKKK